MDRNKIDKKIRVNRKNNGAMLKDGKKVQRYHNDYSPKYGEGFDIYEKAKEKARKVKKGEN